MTREGWSPASQRHQAPRQAPLCQRSLPPARPGSQVFDGPPATVAELAAVEEDLTAGAMQADVVATNQTPLDLQLLQASGAAQTCAAGARRRSMLSPHRQGQPVAGG